MEDRGGFAGGERKEKKGSRPARKTETAAPRPEEHVQVQWRQRRFLPFNDTRSLFLKVEGNYNKMLRPPFYFGPTVRASALHSVAF